MADKSGVVRCSRRELASLAIALAPASLAAQQPAASDSDLLQRRRDGIAGNVASLEKTPLTPADEPMFALVLK
ncbi:MAG: hypothetical protein LC114_03355 [Bryobacterales bacterium]|nr:hypothetical protein [Bryobacterales bacterium]